MKLKTFHALAVGTRVVHEASARICSYVKVDADHYRIDLHDPEFTSTHGELIPADRLIGEGDVKSAKHVHVA